VGEFGDKFRTAREKKELSFDDVANVTKIGSRMLQAIEEEHFDQLPGGVFNKGFIRAYAKHLGLNAEDAVTDYLACLRQAQIDAHEVWQPERPAPPRAAAPEKPRLVGPARPEPNKPALNQPAAKFQPPAPIEELPELQLPRAEHVRPRGNDFAGRSDRSIRWRILAITAALVILVVVLWTRRSHNTNTAAASSSPAKTVPQTVQAPPPAPTLPSVQAPKKQPVATQPASGAPAHASTPNSQPPQGPAVPAATAASSPATPPAVDATESVNDSNDVTVRSFPKSNPQPSEKSAATLTLVIHATETSWISVTADGQIVSQETLIAPAHTSIRATREIVAKIGNAAGVTFLWNGHEIPASGSEAEVKTFVFDSNGMRELPPTPPPPQ